MRQDYPDGLTQTTSGLRLSEHGKMRKSIQMRLKLVQTLWISSAILDFLQTALSKAILCFLVMPCYGIL